MKRLPFIFILLSILIGKAFSAEPVQVTVETDKSLIKNEAYLSIGTVSCIGLFGGAINAIADSISEAKNDKPEEEKEPFEAFSVGLGYNLYLFDILGFGGFLNYEKFGSLNLLSAQAKLTVQYGFTHFKFYHAVSGGALFISDNAICPVFDVTLLGLKLDFEDFNIFLEGSLPSTAFLKLGFGYYF